MPKNPTQCPQPGLEPGPLTLESSALTICMRPQGQAKEIGIIIYAPALQGYSLSGNKYSEDSNYGSRTISHVHNLLKLNEIICLFKACWYLHNESMWGSIYIFVFQLEKDRLPC